MRNHEVIDIDGEVAALVLGMFVTVVAMLAAVVGIRIAKAYLNGSAHAERDIENDRGANHRSPQSSQCTQYSHGVEIYHNPFAK